VLEFNRDILAQQQTIEKFLLYIKGCTDADYNLFKEESGKINSSYYAQMSLHGAKKVAVC